MITFDASFLTSYYAAKSGAGSAMNIPVKNTSPSGTTKAPTAPWDAKSNADGSADLAKKALLGAKFIRESNISLDLPGASQDYKKLFTLYQALNTLQGIVERAQEKNVSATSMRTLERVFAKGMNEIQGYLDKTTLEHVGLVQGQLTERLKSTTGVPRANPTYVGKPVHQGTATDSVKAFEGDVKFTIRIDPPKAGIYEPKIIEVNLADMEAGVTRSMGNVTAFINEKLGAKGVSTRFAVERTPAVPKKAMVNGKEVIIDKGKDSFALKVNGSTTEILSFSAEKMSDSVYVVQTSGDTDNDNKNKPETLNDLSRQILKFQADISDTQASVTRSGVGDSYWVEGRSAQSSLEDSIKAVHQTVSGPDGSVYVLANVDGEIDGQGIKGAQDVALIKYDSAGNVVYTRTLGAVDTASGYAMAISDDGRVAITGSVKGQLTTETTYSFTTDSGAVYSQNSYNYSKGYDKSITDSFVTVFDASGVEEWTQRRGSIGQDEGLSVAFGEDGSVYVGGRAQGVMTGATDGTDAPAAVGSQGGWDAYVMSYGADGTYQATTQFGTTGTDAVSAMTVEGSNLYVASNENGQAVLHHYDLSSGQPVLTDSRNLGHLGGGSISSISVHDNKVYLGGSADITSTGGQPALMSGAAVSSAHKGGFDAFALSVSTDFAQTAHDTVAYYGSDKSERDAKVTFSEGQAWIAFQTTGEVAGTTKLGEKDAVLARMDVATGQVGWQTRYTGKDGEVNPNAIAVSKNSTSVLDQLGLPGGTLLYKDSTTVTSGTSARAGDEFFIRDPKTGVKKKITIDGKDTLESLATKITRATGHKMSVKVTRSGGESVLTITPKYKNAEIEIVRGADGRDALDSLGLSEGLVTNKASPATKLGKNDIKLFGLTLDSGLSIGNIDTLADTKDLIAAAMRNVRSAYRHVRYGDQSEDGANTPGKTGGQVPAYLTSQLSNYQAALSRLTGGG